jgi:HEAT repeat protein
MNAYPIASLLGCLVHVMRHEPDASEPRTALLAALRAATGNAPLRLEADPESLQINGTEVPLATPGAGLVDDQLLGHGIRNAELAAACTDSDILRFASVLASFAGTYDSLDAIRTALGPAAARIILTPGATDFDVLRASQLRPRSVFEPAEAVESAPITGDTGEFQKFREFSLESALAPAEPDASMPAVGSVSEARPPLEALLRLGHDAIAREDWPALLEVGLQMVEAEAEAPSELIGSAHRIELRRLMRRNHLAMVARLAHGERRQDVIALLRRFGAEATEVLMDLLVDAMNLGERRGYYSALSQMSEGLDTIVQHLSHSQWYVVRNAADLCGDMELADAVPALANQARHTDPRVRKAVAGALAKIATPAAMEPLKLLLDDPVAAVRTQVVANLGGRRARAMARALGDQLRKEGDADVQHEALLALGRIGSAESVSILQEWSAPGGKLMGRRPVGIRLTAIRALNGIGPAARPALTALQRDEVPEVRAAVTRRAKAARSRAARSRSSRATSSFGVCMYRSGTDTSPVATPRWAVKMASASVPVTRPAACTTQGMPSASAASSSRSNTLAFTEDPRERTTPAPSATSPCFFFSTAGVSVACVTSTTRATRGVSPVAEGRAPPPE